MSGRVEIVIAPSNLVWTIPFGPLEDGGNVPGELEFPAVPVSSVTVLIDDVYVDAPDHPNPGLGEIVVRYADSC